MTDRVITPIATAATTDGWPDTPGGRPDGIVDPVLRRGTDLGLVIAGLATFGVGYLGALIAAGVDDGNCREYAPYFSHSCDSWPLAFIPIGGAIPSMSVSFTPAGHSSSVAMLVIQASFTVMQIVGLSMFLHAIAGYTLDIDEGYAIGTSARLRFDVGAPGSAAGLTATLDF